MRDDIRQRMTDGDRAQWDAIQEWKAAQVSPRSPRVVTQRIRSYVLAPVKKVVGLAGKIPGGAAIAGWISSGVLGLVEKATAMRLFNKVVRKLTTRGSMESVGNNALTASMNSLFAALGTRLVGMKMAQILPIIGIIVGMALNASLIRTIGVTADNLYRERLLLERYGPEEADAQAEMPSGGADDPDDLDEELARYVELAKAGSRL